MRTQPDKTITETLAINGQFTLVMIPAAELEYLKRGQEQIMERLDQIQAKAPTGEKAPVNYVTAQQFMDAVKIRRWKFDQLIANNLIRTIKKKRKIYLPESEIERYFTDPSIQ
jgi:hypothetical protein